MSLFSANFETSINRLYLMGDVSTGNNNIAYRMGITAGGGSTDGNYLWVGLHTAIPTEAGTGTECSYTGYLRQPMARSATGVWTETAGNPTTYVNVQSIQFPQHTTGATQVAAYWSLWTDQKGTSGEKMLYYGPLVASGAEWHVGYAHASTDANEPNVVVSNTHGLSADDPILIWSPYDGISTVATLADPLAQGTTYYVKAPVATDSFLVADSDTGGANTTIDFTEVGPLLFIKAATLSISVGVIPAFAPGALKIQIA